MKTDNEITRTKYTCPKCKCTWWSSKSPKYCVCGGLLQSITNFVDDLFGDLFKGDK